MTAMLNLLSILIGLVTLILALVAWVPLLGSANWIIIPIAAVGAAIGAMSSGNAGRNLCIVVVAFATLRLSLGGGIL
jgi:hypothetical protein